MIINFAEKVAEIKIVYYGPAAAGKTTSLQYLARRLGVNVVDLPLPGDNDRTVFFEFAPLDADIRKLARQIQFLDSSRPTAIFQDARLGFERRARDSLCC